MQSKETKPFASIIILSHNDFDSTTGPCIKSLQEDPESPAMEIVVVDNASEAKTVSALQELEKQAPIEVIYNDRNLGFAAGNNLGIRHVSSDVIVLLNSDTLVPSGTMRAMANILLANPDFGAVGPVSNAVGNEQAIWIKEKKEEDVLAAGDRWKQQAVGSAIQTGQLSFFCVGFRRELWEKVGELDEDFGQGYYEDVDYCLRIAENRKTLIIAEDIFVYHQGSASFGHQPRRASQLMRRNKQKLFQKHGRSVELIHLREANLRVLKKYLMEKNESASDALVHRFENRLRLASEQMPKGLFKRWSYRRRLDSIVKEWNKT